MPDLNNRQFLIGLAPIATYTGTVNINSGSALAAGASVTENYTFTGAATTDGKIGICPRDATVIPYGLNLVNLVVSATNTVTATWTNATNASITPPASATWTYAAFGEFFR